MILLPYWYFGVKRLLVAFDFTLVKLIEIFSPQPKKGKHQPKKGMVSKHTEAISRNKFHGSLMLTELAQHVNC